MRGHPFPQDAQDRAQEQSLGRRPNPPNLSAYLTAAAAAAAYQPLDTQLTDIAGLSYGSNALKVVRVNAGETAFELGTVSGGGGLTSYGVADSGASAVTSFAYQASGGSAFSLDTKHLLIIRYRLNNVAGVAVNWRFFCNADTTAGNYYSNANLATGGGYSGGNANSARTVDGPSGAEASGLIFVTKDINGCVHFSVQGRDSTGTGLRTIFTSMYWTNPGAADVTDFIVSCTTASGTGAHSTYEVFSP